MLEKILKRNLLKYSAGRAITCPKCGNIADYRRWVIWESPAGSHGAHCADCWREGLALIHDDKPHAYLLSIGWQVDTLVDFDKKPRQSKPLAMPKDTRASRQAFIDKLRGREYMAQLCSIGYRQKKDQRVFPAIVFAERYPLTYNDDGEWSNGYLTEDYVVRYCRLNHLTGV